jgi:hypothetical protein
LKPFSNLAPVARLVVLAYAALAAVGLYVSVYNMPVISGCKFYGECPGGAIAGDGLAGREPL